MRRNGLDEDGFIEREGGLEVKLAAAVAREPAADRAALTVLIGDLGPWLAAEYLAEHGRKAPRAGNPAG